MFYPFSSVVNNVSFLSYNCTQMQKAVKLFNFDLSLSIVILTLKETRALTPLRGLDPCNPSGKYWIRHLEEHSFYLISVVTDCVRSRREGYVLTRVCPSVCLSTPRGVPQPGSGGGGYPSQVQVGGTHQGGTPAQSDLARGST